MSLLSCLPLNCWDGICLVSFSLLARCSEPQHSSLQSIQTPARPCVPHAVPTNRRQYFLGCRLTYVYPRPISTDGTVKKSNAHGSITSVWTLFQLVWKFFWRSRAAVGVKVSTTSEYVLPWQHWQTPCYKLHVGCLKRRIFIFSFWCFIRRTPYCNRMFRMYSLDNVHTVPSYQYTLIQTVSWTGQFRMACVNDVISSHQTVGDGVRRTTFMLNQH